MSENKRDYAVGHGKPPVRRRFKESQSSNRVRTAPGGRDLHWTIVPRAACGSRSAQSREKTRFDAEKRSSDRP
jgi:hypothetical protein